ncbi:helix-turn-helix domain-containing protein [Aquihabitans sp. McL0605]|uniref:helix-turn-helix domain-containing protein n=1 Tax=Aquihabitans sp. McL0605 TaxID=3415671 RepID=UPI003CFB3D55
MPATTPSPSPTPTLADFLRTRREQLAPADVGLRATGRRRTPGLRREEVATLAGVSIDYLVRIEQGRDTNPSASVLTALAVALQLDEDQRMHLFRLAAHAGPNSEMCPAVPPLVDDVAPTVHLLLDQLDPSPAFVVDPLNDVVASNRAWRTLVEPLGLADHTNLAHHVFLHPDAPTIYADWDQAADSQVSTLHAASLRWGDHPRYAAVVDLLTPLPAFTDRMATHPVAEKRRGPKRLVHPGAGELRLAFETLGLADHEHRLIAWLPADDATAGALRHLVAAEQPMSPAQLRVVGEP